MLKFQFPGKMSRFFENKYRHQHIADASLPSLQIIEGEAEEPQHVQLTIKLIEQSSDVYNHDNERNTKPLTSSFAEVLNFWRCY